MFDYYLSPSGDDDNAGTLLSPWSITALNSKQATYAGKRVGFLPGTYQYGTVGGVQTTLYSLYQAQPGTNSGCVLQVNGGSAGAPTYLGSSDAAGRESPRTATIDASNPSGGAAPTIEGDLLGQNYYGGASGPANVGYLTISGLVIKSFTHAAITFTHLTQPIYGVTIQNNEISGGGNVQSNNNPGAIFLSSQVTGFLITNNKIHDCQTSSGSYFPWGFAGIMCIAGAGAAINSGTISWNTIYKVAQPVATKDNQQQVNIYGNYLEMGNFGSLSGTALAHGIHSFVTGSGATIGVHDNIIVGDIYGFGEDGSSNQGTINCYNNTFFWPLSNQDVIYVPNGTGGAWNFYNNLVYSTGPNPGYDNSGNNASSIWVANLTGITAANFDYNAYGANTNGIRFAKDWTTNFGLTLAQWQGAGYGFDTHSASLASSPFSGTPAQADPTTYAITGSALTAGRSGGPCGAVYGIQVPGCGF